MNPEQIETDDPAGAVAEVIERLTGKDEVPAQDIVVLSAHNMKKSAVGQAGAGEYEFTDTRPGPFDKKIRFSSIRSFKGLESPVVILVELDEIEGETAAGQTYVGMTRARNHLVVVERTA